jgi:predicted nucleotidyltransferase
MYTVFMEMMRFPERYQKEILAARDLLKAEGCKKVYVFGSMVTGNMQENSDLDIGISGLPPEKFFKVYAKLDQSLNTAVDLVDFDESRDFFSLLNRLNEVVQIG